MKSTPGCARKSPSCAARDSTFATANKTTRNVGKLLGEAGKSRALSAIIFGKDIADNRIDLKDLQSGTQETISLTDLEIRLKDIIARYEQA
jgi:histidyl-tRNA synthetase